MTLTPTARRQPGSAGSPLNNTEDAQALLAEGGFEEALEEALTLARAPPRRSRIAARCPIRCTSRCTSRCCSSSCMTSSLVIGENMAKCALTSPSEKSGPVEPLLGGRECLFITGQRLSSADGWCCCALYCSPRKHLAWSLT